MLTPILTVSPNNVITVRMTNVDYPATSYGALRVRLFLQNGQKCINPLLLTYTGKLRFLDECMKTLEFYIAGDEISKV